MAESIAFLPIQQMKTPQVLTQGLADQLGAI
jgi:hypothetical protein